MTDWTPGTPVYSRPQPGYAAHPIFTLKEEPHDNMPASDAARWPDPFPTLDLENQ